MMPASGAGGRRFESDQPHNSSSSLIGFTQNKSEYNENQKECELLMHTHCLSML